jgi:NAD(P)H-hydrate epimerase
MPGSVLMENAGEALAQAALKEAGEGGRFFVLCGMGNNGGDGLVAARKLAGLRRAVFCELTGEGSALQGDALRNFEALKASGLECAPISAELTAGPGDVIIDALLGTGLSRAPEARIADAIGRISAWRASGARVVSADLPSGLESDTGIARSPCVSADVTLTFGYAKAGQVVEPGASRCGRLEIVDIGIPRAAEQVLREPPLFLLEEGDVRGRLPKRVNDSHKGTYGHVLIVGGSWGKTGAAALAAMGALRGGAGLVTVATRPEALVPVMEHAPEIMGVELVNDGPLGHRDLNSLLEAAEGKDAVVFGPGIERGDDTNKLLAALLEELTVPCVIDADGLNAMAGRLTMLQTARCDLVLTPHPGEMGRLLGLSTAEVQANRIALARAFAKDHHVTLLLKGARSLISRDDGVVFINATGNAGMATGGTGDVLSGLIGALIAQGLSTEDATIVGAWAHGLAGDVVKERRGEMGLIASDLLDGLTEVWRRWGR